MKAKFIRYSATLTLACFLSSCVTTQDQFAGAITSGNVSMARATAAPDYANMRIYANPQQYAVPVQIAIAHNDKAMAQMLLQNGVHHQLEGENLAYYSAYRGHTEMARFFVSQGVGRSSDISLAINDRSARERQQRADAAKALAFVVGVVTLASAMESQTGGGGGGGVDDGTRAAIYEQNQRNDYRQQMDNYNAGIGSSTPPTPP